MSDPLVNLEAEAELLGNLLANRASPDILADLLRPEDFGESVHGRIFSAAIREASAGRPHNPIALKSYLEGDEDLKLLGGLPYLAKLCGIVPTFDVRDCADMIAALSRRRRMRDGLRVASDACADLEIPASEIIEHADEALSDPTRELLHQPTGAEAISELLQGYRDKAPGVSSRVIASLDRLLGPLRPKQLIIMAARPGMGKTAVAISYSIGVARSGHGVLFVSLEMSSAELAGRMVADLCFDDERNGVPYGAIRDGTLNDWQMRRIVEAESRMRGLPFQIVDTGTLTTGRLAMLVRRHARRMEAQGRKLELVVVDYLQLLRPDGRRLSSYEAVSEISRSLKAIAKDNGVAVLALAQLSREVEKRADKRPILSDLRDSGQIEQDADAVLFLLRQEYYLRQEEPDQMSTDRLKWEQAMDQVRGGIDFILAKRRNGTTGTATGQFHGAFQAVRG